MDLSDYIKNKKHKELRQLLSGNPALANSANEQGLSFLMLATYYRDSEAVAIFRQFKKELNLHEAAAIGDLDTVIRLLSTNQDLINKPATDGFSALGLACFFGHFKIAKHLIDSGADVNQASENSFQVAPLHSACAISSLDIVQLLLENGADPNVQQQAGITPLHEAAHHGKADIVRLLLKHGADPDMESEQGLTAIDFAKRDGHAIVVALLGGE